MSGTAAARLTVNSEAGSMTSSSTNTVGTFRLVNLSTGGQRITSFKIDLRTAMLPDLVFDPFGTAGDIDGKAFGLDYFDGSGTPVHSFESPHNGIGSQDGYDVLRVDFGPTVDFGPGDLLRFSSDVDPTSIKGAIGPGPNHSGSVSGLELVGATVTITFSDATVRVVRMGGWNHAGTNNNKTSVGVLAPDNLATPVLSVPGRSSPFSTDTLPTVRVTGPAGATGRLWWYRSELAVAGVAGGGYDIDPYETNMVVDYGGTDFTLPAGGFVDIPMTASRFKEAGIHKVAAILSEATESGRRSSSSDVLTIDYDPAGGGGGGTTGDTQVPSPPGSLQATPGDGMVGLSWTAATDDIGVVAYRIYRGGAQIAEVTGLGFTDSAVVNGTTYSYQVTARDAAGKESSAVSATATPAGGGTVGEALLRVNVGSGGAFTDPQGKAWLADFGFNTGNPSSHSNAIQGTANPFLYQSRRTISTSQPDLAYAFDLPAGSYRVLLHFVETVGTFTTGSRVFDIVAEGELKVDNLDIFDRAGLLTACVVEIPVLVGDGQLNLVFPRVASNPTISGIEVFPVVPDEPPPTFEDWLAGHGLAGQSDADSDGGGQDNFAEFELQLDPKDPADDLAFRLRCEPGAGGTSIRFPELKPLGNYHLHRSSDLTALANPANRIATVTRAEIAAMTAEQRATHQVEDPAAGGRMFYQLFFEPAGE